MPKRVGTAVAPVCSQTPAISPDWQLPSNCCDRPNPRPDAQNFHSPREENIVVIPGTSRRLRTRHLKRINQDSTGRWISGARFTAAVKAPVRFLAHDCQLNPNACASSTSSATNFLIFETGRDGRTARIRPPDEEILRVVDPRTSPRSRSNSAKPDTPSAPTRRGVSAKRIRVREGRATLKKSRGGKEKESSVAAGRWVPRFSFQCGERFERK